MKLLALASLLFNLPAFADFRGAYEVPVPEELRPYARYEFNDLRVRVKSGDRLEVRYQLPLALAGEENHLRFEGAIVDGQAHMKNEQGEMTCTVAEKMCRVKYQNIAFSLEKAEAALRSENLSEEDVRGRLLVSARFGGDMEGVLFFRQLD